MNTLTRAVFAALLAVAGPVAAQDDEAAPVTTGVARPGWYVAPMATYMMSDTARCNVDDGLGGSVMFGHRGDFASIEVWGQFLTAPKGTCSYVTPGPATPDPTDDESVTVTEPEGEVGFNGGGIGLVLGPFFENVVLQRFFALVGFGVILREDHPQYTSDDSTMFGDAGLGYMHPFELWGFDMNLRAEGRYRYDVQQPPYPSAAEQDPPPEHSFQDLIFNVGVQVALSPRPEVVAAAAPEPVSVVATADADADGVPDGKDTCPDTVAGTAVDDTGCVPAAPVPAEVTLETAKVGDTIVLHGVNFETARATLTTNARTLLDGVAKSLVARPELRLEVGGHTDSRGDEGYNQTLSEQRAQSVQDYLVEQGVGAERLSAVGYGEAQPVDSNETDEGRERNRRVELKILE
jgi:outer membrane protein OmpA-like peptidoglycan-associated protein